MIDRRKLLKMFGLGSLFGTPAVATAHVIPNAAPKPGNESVMTIYVNVGLLSPQRAEAYIKRLKDNLGPAPQGWHRYFFPVRPPQQTRVEVTYLNGEPKREVQRVVEIIENTKRIQPAKLDQPRPPEFWAKDSKETCDYILLMLGAPIVKVELDQQQLDLCYVTALNVLNEHFYNHYGFTASDAVSFPHDFHRDLAIGFATTMLGRIRSKCQLDKNYPILDGPSLYKDGKDRIFEARERLTETYC